MADHGKSMRAPQNTRDALRLKFKMEQEDRDCLKNALDGILQCSAKVIQWPGMNKEQRSAFDHTIIFGASKDISEAVDKVAREMSMHYAAKIFLVIDALRVAAESFKGPESIVIQQQTIHTRSLSSRVCRQLISLSSYANANGSPGRVMNNYLEVIQNISITGHRIRDVNMTQELVYIRIKCLSLNSVNQSPYDDDGGQAANSPRDVQGELNGPTYTRLREVSDELFAFKPDMSNGIPNRFNGGGKRHRLWNSIESRTTKLSPPSNLMLTALKFAGDNQLANTSVPVSEASYHQRTWVYGNSNDGISTECALKRYTAPEAPVGDEAAMSTQVSNESNADSRRMAQIIDAVLPCMHALSHLKDGGAEYLRQRGILLHEAYDPIGRLGEKVNVEENPSKHPLKEALSASEENGWVPVEKNEKTDEDDEWCML